MRRGPVTTFALLGLCLLLLLFLSNCGGAAARDATEEENGLFVFAAASLTGVFPDLARAFEAQTNGVETAFNFAGSQQLAQQLTAGAPADVFASANGQQMDVVVAAGGIDAADVQIFARNALVVIYPAHNPGQIQTLADLARPNLRLVLADPRVPAGRYAQAFLEKATTEGRFGADYEENVLSNVSSYEQSVRAVLTKVILGEADAGIVYRSDLRAAEAENVEQMIIPDPLNAAAAYTIAPLQDGPRPAQAQAFVDYLFTRQAQCLLQEYGFVPLENMESPCQS